MTARLQQPKSVREQVERRGEGKLLSKTSSEGRGDVMAARCVYREPGRGQRSRSDALLLLQTVTEHGGLGLVRNIEFVSS